MEDVVCKKCGLVNDYRTEMKANNLTAWCNGCGSYIKNVPYDNNPKLYFGKYKGRELASMRSEEEIKWLQWAVKQDFIKSNTKTQFETHLKSLNRL